MKKLLRLALAACMFLFIAVLIVFMCWPQNISHVKSLDGVLDLRSETAEMKIAPLHGQWDFAYGELLTPDQFEDKHSDSITVPSSWDSMGYDLNGFATYRLTVFTEYDGALTLFIPEISAAYALWVNGELIRTAGKVSDKPEDSELFYENALLPIRAENGVVQIVMQVSNYQNVYAGINDTILLGETQAVQAWYIQTRGFYCMALGCILMAGFYHLALYAYRSRDKVYIMFSLLCFLCFARFLFETNGLNEYFQWIPDGIFTYRLYMILFLAHAVVLSIFSLYIFNSSFLWKHKCIIAAVIAALAVIVIGVPLNTKLFLVVTTGSILPMSLLVVIVAALSPVFKESVVTRLYFVALIIYLIVGSTSKLFYDNVIFMTGLLSNMFMIMVQSLVLSKKYTDAFLFVEETNLNLERIVDERTRSLQDANAAMLSTNNAMKELVASISHDLKTPLSILSVNLETLSSLATTQSDETYQRHVRIAYQKNLDLQRILQNLFDVSRIETGRNIYSPKWMSILYLMAQAKEKYDAFLDDKGIVFDIAVDEDMEIWSDPQKIWSVFDNIIYNAARYTESNGSITITACNHGSHATVAVTDTGCGILQEHLPHVFKRFYKASQARGVKDGDSGLGLYIVKNVMEGCGGRVEVQSESGKGTTLILMFVKKD